MLPRWPKKNLLTGESGVFGQDGLRLPISVAGGVSSGKGEGAGDALFCRLETGVNGEDSIALWFAVAKLCGWLLLTGLMSSKYQ